jgi:hypothetical protein
MSRGSPDKHRIDATPLYLQLRAPLVASSFQNLIDKKLLELPLSPSASAKPTVLIDTNRGFLSASLPLPFRPGKHPIGPSS